MIMVYRRVRLKIMIMKRNSKHINNSNDYMQLRIAIAITAVAANGYNDDGNSKID